MSHNLVVQSCMTKLLSVWTHLKTSKVLVLRSAFNFMVGKILRVTFLVPINEYCKKGSVQNRFYENFCCIWQYLCVFFFYNNNIIPCDLQRLNQNYCYSYLYEHTVHFIEQHSMLKWSLVLYLSNETKTNVFNWKLIVLHCQKLGKIFFQNIGRTLKKLSLFFENFTDIFESEKCDQTLQRICWMPFRCMDRILSKEIYMNIIVALHSSGPTLIREHCVKNVKKWVDVVVDHMVGERKVVASVWFRFYILIETA